MHLAREPVSAVRSMAARGWFEEDEYREHRHDWALFRLSASEMGLMSEEQWGALTPLDKCLWYWMHVNSSIEHDLKKIPGHRACYVRLERLESEIIRIQKFLEIDVMHVDTMKTNVVKPQHRKAYEAIDHKLTFDSTVLEKTRNYLSQSEFDFNDMPLNT